MKNISKQFDEPIQKPDNDLLETIPYAKKLAKFIQFSQPPFTLGIYGEWGSGKTSFVRLVEFYLSQEIRRKKLEKTIGSTIFQLNYNPIEDLLMLRNFDRDKRNYQEKLIIDKLTHQQLDKKIINQLISESTNNQFDFIYFSAWPFSTSDTIWKALVLKITKALYQETNKEPELHSHPKSIFEQWKNYLSSDFLLFSSPPKKKNPNENFEKILNSLDEMSYGSISKDSKLQYQFNQEVAITTIIEGALEALGSVSPIINFFRKLFGLEFKPNLSSIFQKEKNESTRKMIESVEMFRKLLKKIFEQRKDKPITCIFIDDLDRVLPDVALDILEAIKIFLHDIPCIFIVAADRKLIGQGLQLRYLDLFGNSDSEKTKNFLDKKGQEYFEKIIQFGINVPTKTEKQTHNFIAAQFPKWIPATDIIRATIGSNPRRIKQYCNSLNYSFMVHQLKLESINTKKEIEKPEELSCLNKMVKVFAWSQSCSNQIGKIAEEFDSVSKFNTVMNKLEKALIATDLDQAIEKDALELKGVQCEVIYRKIVDSAPLLEIFKEEPMFSSFKPSWVATFAKFSDIRPVQGGSIYTSDPTFMRIYNLSKIAFSTEKMMIENLARLVDFFNWVNQLSFIDLKWFFDLAESKKWLEGISLLEQAFENPKTFLGGKNEFLNSFNGLNELIDSLKKIKEETGLENNSEIKKSDFNKFKSYILKEPRLSTILSQEVSILYNEYKLNNYSFNSLLGNNYKNLNENQKRLKGAEDFYNNIENQNKDFIITSLELRFFVAKHFRELRSIAKLNGLDYGWPELANKTRLHGHKFIEAFEANLEDESPISFETLKEYFKDEALLKFFSIEPFFRNIPPNLLNQFLAISQQQPKEITDLYVNPLKTEESLLYDQLNIWVKEKSKNQFEYITSIQINDEEKVEGISTIDIDYILKEFSNINFQKNFSGTTVTRNIIYQPNKSPEDFGVLLQNALFANNKELNAEFEKAIKTPNRLRIILRFVDEKLYSIPWEIMYLRKNKTFVSITQKLSLIRFFPPTQMWNQGEFGSPLRILIATARPKDSAYLELEQEKDIILKTLDNSINLKQVEVHVIKNTTREGLQSALRFFEPHIFHFSGHATYREGKGYIILENESDASSDYLDTEDLAVLLDSFKINLVILNACDTATHLTNQISSGMAGRLVEKGIPAVIALTKPILDSTALKFTKEFYQALIDGYTIEASMSEARKSLWLEKLDWYSYILCTSQTKFDQYKIKNITERKGFGS